MYTNILLLKVKNMDDIDYVMAELCSMKGRIPSLQDIKVRRNQRETGYDIVVLASYENSEGMDAYLVDPMHVAVSDNIIPKIETLSTASYAD